MVRLLAQHSICLENGVNDDITHLTVNTVSGVALEGGCDLLPLFLTTALKYDL
jgi:hypothetical protein